jgi:hypothetical protein
MLSSDLRRLSHTFEDWINGRVTFTVPDARAFARDLKLAYAEAAMLELGIDPKLFSAVIASEQVDSNVILFPRQHAARRVEISERDPA